jgi:hypothetical protein
MEAIMDMRLTIHPDTDEACQFTNIDDLSLCSVYRISEDAVLFTRIMFSKTVDYEENYEEEDEIFLPFVRARLRCAHVLFRYSIVDSELEEESNYLQQYCIWDSADDSDGETGSKYLKFIEASPIVYTWTKELAHSVQKFIVHILFTKECKDLSCFNAPELSCSLYMLSDDAVLFSWITHF